MSIGVNPQSLIRNASTASKAWEILRSFHLRRNIHNRIQKKKELHQFKLVKNGDIMHHSQNFDYLCLSMEALGDGISEDEKLVILLGSLSDEYDQISKIIGDIQGIDILQAKDMLRREFEGLQRREAYEVALRATKYKNKTPHKEWKGVKTFRKKVNIRCLHCNKVGHMKYDCWKLNNPTKEKSEHAFSSYEDNQCGWILDSGASSPISFNEKDFSQLRSMKNHVSISIANGEKLERIGIGNIHSALANGKNIRVENVLYVPKLDKGLLSSNCEISSETSKIISIERNGKTFLLHGTIYENTLTTSEQLTQEASEEIWHAKLGHISKQRMDNARKCVTGYNIDAIQSSLDEDNVLREGCLDGKSFVKPFPQTTYRKIKTKATLELVHNDVMGPMRTKSHGGSMYIISFIDDYSRYVEVYFLKSKTEAVDSMIHYKALMENQIGTTMKSIRTDNGTGYINKTFGEICLKNGIRHQTTIPSSPQQNELTEG
uniref:Putative polyprotein n=1 Tax=Albugo laibachii Nc14 TaxID=890382 RepID=F0WTJ6_9STRA|nr:putative polyprotein [Albugo laibachii Nc14]CCA26369.1 putative polyprotein [Albugo laibachii Nc14]|eukprot:CCA26369.1 putative polyprotein [Albugo laibachii Nc14]